MSVTEIRVFWVVTPYSVTDLMFKELYCLQGIRLLS
jgi:hypothetical protein